MAIYWGQHLPVDMVDPSLQLNPAPPLPYIVKSGNPVQSVSLNMDLNQITIASDYVCMECVLTKHTEDTSIAKKWGVPDAPLVPMPMQPVVVQYIPK